MHSADPEDLVKVLELTAMSHASSYQKVEGSEPKTLKGHRQKLKYLWKKPGQKSEGSTLKARRAPRDEDED